MRGPLGSVTMPVLSRLQSDPVRLAKGIQAVLRLVAIVAFPIFTFLACTGTLIVTFLLGPTWTSIGFLVQLFAIAELIKTLVVFAYPTLMACGRARQCLVLQCAHACGTLIAASAGLRWGATGVGFGLVSNSCFIALTSLFMVSNVTPLRLKDYFAAVWRPFTLSIVMSSVVLGILFLFPANMSTAIQTLAVMVIAPITYLALLALFTPEDLNELQRTLRTALGPEISETLVRIAKRLTLRLS